MERWEHSVFVGTHAKHSNVVGSSHILTYNSCFSEGLPRRDPGGVGVPEPAPGPVSLHPGLRRARAAGYGGLRVGV